MNTNTLKKFAQEARKKLIEQIGAKLELVLTSDSSLLREKASQVKKLQETKKQPARSKSNYNQPKRKETLPDWAKEDVVRKETPLSAEEAAFFQDQLKQLAKKPKEGDN